jgi:hypothetical protein
MLCWCSTDAWLACIIGIKPACWWTTGLATGYGLLQSVPTVGMRGSSTILLRACIQKLSFHCARCVRLGTCRCSSAGFAVDWFSSSACACSCGLLHTMPATLHELHIAEIQHISGEN